MNTIAIIDDNPDLVELLFFMLKKAKYEVKDFFKSDNLINDIANDQPSLILLDVFLLSRDGKEICKELKTNPLTSSIPVLLFSVRNMTEEVVLQCKADGFLRKPFEMDTLKTKIAELVSNHYVN